MAQVELRAVTKTFGKTTALDGVNLTIKDGEFFVLLGPSGAGKSTTISIISGITAPTRGQVVINGVDVTAEFLAEVAFTAIGLGILLSRAPDSSLAVPLEVGLALAVIAAM